MFMRWTATLALACILAAACGRERPPKPGEQRSGLFLIQKDGKWGFVDREGNVKIPPQFDQAAPFSDDLAVVALGGRAGYIDKNGKFVINPQFVSAAPFSEGLAAVRSGNAWGFIDKTGKIVVPAQFQDLGTGPIQFSEGLAAVSRGQDTPVGYIDKQGRMAIAPQFDFAQPFSDGLALVGIAGRESIDRRTCRFRGHERQAGHQPAIRSRQ
jgi:hypothetical protein